jgi:hypothetical protein
VSTFSTQGLHLPSSTSTLAAVLATSTTLPLIVQPQLWQVKLIPSPVRVWALVRGDIALLANRRGVRVAGTAPTRKERRGVNIEDTWIICFNAVVEKIGPVRSQLILARAHTIRIIAARTLDPDVDMVRITACTKTVEDDEFLQVGSLKPSNEWETYLMDHWTYISNLATGK